MSRRKKKDEFCKCGSGKKHSECCSLLEPVRWNSHYFISGTDPQTQSPMSLYLHKLTGYYADDFIKPVRKIDRNIFDILSDESRFKDQYCVSLVLIPHLPERIKNQIESELQSLKKEFDLDNIHFTKIFDQKMF